MNKAKFKVPAWTDKKSREKRLDCLRNMGVIQQWKSINIWGVWCDRSKSDQEYRAEPAAVLVRAMADRLYISIGNWATREILYSDLEFVIHDKKGRSLVLLYWGTPGRVCSNGSWSLDGFHGDSKPELVALKLKAVAGFRQGILRPMAFGIASVAHLDVVEQSTSGLDNLFESTFEHGLIEGCQAKPGSLISPKEN